MHSTALFVPIELSALGKGIEYEFVFHLPQSLQTNVATATQVRQRTLPLYCFQIYCFQKWSQFSSTLYVENKDTCVPFDTAGYT